MSLCNNSIWTSPKTAQIMKKILLNQHYENTKATVFIKAGKMLPHFKLTKEHKFWQQGENELIAKQAGRNVDTDDIWADLTLFH